MYLDVYKLCIQILKYFLFIKKNYETSFSKQQNCRAIFQTKIIIRAESSRNMSFFYKMNSGQRLVRNICKLLANEKSAKSQIKSFVNVLFKRVVQTNMMTYLQGLWNRGGNFSFFFIIIQYSSHTKINKIIYSTCFRGKFAARHYSI